HPLDYGDFEGTIPKGQYGGGTVMLWDRGTWRPDGDVDVGLGKGKLAFELIGERLKGHWALVRLRGRPGDRGKDNWLLIKEKDSFAKSGRPITEREKTSVATGRTMAEIAQGSKVWGSRQRGKPRAAESKRAGGKDRGGSPGKKARKKKSGPVELPSFVKPQLATLVDVPPSGGDWIHEIKYDGYRAQAAIADGTVVIRTRNGLDWTDKFASLVPALSALPCRSALLDGEIAVADAQGHTDFGKLQDALSNGRGGLSYFVFDLLALDGADLRKRPLIERKDALRDLLKKSGSPLTFSDHVDGAGDRVFQHACDLKLEGIISKRSGDPYRSGRTTSWLKTKCGMAQEFVIVGWQPSRKKSRPFASILLAVRDENALRYAGRVGSGFSDRTLDRLSKVFAQYARKKSPIDDIPAAIARGARFLEPALVAEIAFRGWTRDGLVRQGSFKGLRADKPARAIVKEKPMSVKKAAAKKGRPAPRPGDDETDQFAGVHVTHPDRVLFPGQGVTKRALIDYYLGVADRMLPHVAGRPLSLVRCPRGSEKDCFFQKHASPGWPDEFKHVRIREKSGNDDYLYIEDERGLVAAAQMGVLELHIWGSRVDDVEHPDRLVFDFDPDETLPFAAVKKAAQAMKARLEALGLQSFPMVTGGKGIHVVVPLTPGHAWDRHREFAEALARVMAEDEPERFVATMSKAKRKGKIFIDYLRNQRGATAIAPYSSRARKGAHIALPVSWRGLSRLDTPHPMSVTDAPARLRRAAEAWPDYFDVRQKLPKLT
ncbi:MAG: DNA ligase D, partial [Pseudolabrys sp.]|nr:DNA ligase D [Pseudolabrys sp.]